MYFSHHSLSGPTQGQRGHLDPLLAVIGQRQGYNLDVSLPCLAFARPHEVQIAFLTDVETECGLYLNEDHLFYSPQACKWKYTVKITTTKNIYHYIAARVVLASHRHKQKARMKKDSISVFVGDFLAPQHGFLPIERLKVSR